MRQIAFVTLLLFAGAAACGLLSAPAHAEDEVPGKAGPQEDAAAERLFREGWWQETGAGALEKAATSYRQAVAAEGSAAVRARAQYRLALVLERMGRVEQAVRALEALAEQFSDQTALLAKARTKLEAWSGEDLREHFTDWYRRYQYSPAFQSKIVDLVLQLGTKAKSAGAVYQELLTIGEPALPALRAHATSANYLLRSAVVRLMLEQEVLPPAHALFESSIGYRAADLLLLLPTLEEPAREAFAKATRACPGSAHARRALAVLAGPSAMIELMAGHAGKSESLVPDLWRPLLASQPSPGDLQRLRALPSDPNVARLVHRQVAQYLASGHDWTGEQVDPTGFTEAELLAWAESDEASLRMVVWRTMTKTPMRDVDAWKIPLRALEEVGRVGKGARTFVADALLTQLRLVPVGTRVPSAVQALVGVLEQTGRSGPWLGLPGLQAQPRNGAAGSALTPRRVFAEALSQAQGPYLYRQVGTWWNTTNEDPASLDTLLAWIGQAADPSVRKQALQYAARALRTGPARILAALGDPERQGELAAPLFTELLHPDDLSTEGWDRESLTRLVETAQLEVLRTRAKGSGMGASKNSSISHGGVRVIVKTRLSHAATGVIYRLLQDDSIREQMLEAAVAAPERFTADIWPLLGQGWSDVPENRAHSLSFLQRGWAQWSAEQRDAGLRLFLAEELVGRGDAELNTLLRSVLTDPETSLAARRSAAQALSDLKLEDVTAAFDLGQLEEAGVAVGFLPRLPRAEETYDAFKPVLGPKTMSTASVQRIQKHFRQEPESRVADLVERLLAAPEGYQAAFHAAEILKSRGKAKDLPLWRLALKHPDDTIRWAAATALGNLYDDVSIRALALVVDDPAPEVRDAALTSLERIETIEKQKAHWRKFAEGK